MSAEFPATSTLAFLVRHDPKDGEVLGIDFDAAGAEQMIEGLIEGVVHDTFGHIQVVERITRDGESCASHFGYRW